MSQCWTAIGPPLCGHWTAPRRASNRRRHAASADSPVEFLSDYPIDHITTSEYLRARQSIEPFAGRSGLAIDTDVRLNERTLSAEPLDNWQDFVRDSFDDHDTACAGRRICSRSPSSCLGCAG